MAKLGVNIDHVATLRQARREFDPDPVLAARICEEGGADSIVVHLREDRRHIQDRDLRRLRRSVRTRLNLEMSLNPSIIRIAASVKPDQATFVPEKRAEITTEGGLNAVKYFKRLQAATRRLTKAGIEVSVFIDPVKHQIDSARNAGICMIELHTGRYDRASGARQRQRELQKLKKMTRYAKECGMVVNAGHGLKYHNVRSVARIPGMKELNIGHSIIARAVFVGLKQAVREMKRLV